MQILCVMWAWDPGLSTPGVACSHYQGVAGASRLLQLLSSHTSCSGPVVTRGASAAQLEQPLSGWCPRYVTGCSKDTGEDPV